MPTPLSPNSRVMRIKFCGVFFLGYFCAIANHRVIQRSKKAYDTNKNHAAYQARPAGFEAMRNLLPHLHIEGVVLFRTVENDHRNAIVHSDRQGLVRLRRFEKRTSTWKNHIPQRNAGEGTPHPKFRLEKTWRSRRMTKSPSHCTLYCIRS